MNIPKAQILELLTSRGDHEKAQQADSELPDQVDTEKDSGLLESLGLDPRELLAGLGGLGKLGGGLGKLGGLGG